MFAIYGNKILPFFNNGWSYKLVKDSDFLALPINRLGLDLYYFTTYEHYHNFSRQIQWIEFDYDFVNCPGDIEILNEPDCLITFTTKVKDFREYAEFTHGIEVMENLLNDFYWMPIGDGGYIFKFNQIRVMDKRGNMEIFETLSDVVKAYNLFISNKDIRDKLKDFYIVDFDGRGIHSRDKHENIDRFIDSYLNECPELKAFSSIQGTQLYILTDLDIFKKLSNMITANTNVKIFLGDDGIEDLIHEDYLMHDLDYRALSIHDFFRDFIEIRNLKFILNTVYKYCNTEYQISINIDYNKNISDSMSLNRFLDKFNLK